MSRKLTESARQGRRRISLLAVNRDCFYTDENGPNANPVGVFCRPTRFLLVPNLPRPAELAKAK
jgi:hypothetical protein